MFEKVKFASTKDFSAPLLTSISDIIDSISSLDLFKL